VSGVENPDTVDLVTFDPPGGLYKLIMVETRPWDPSPERLAQLRLKVDNHVAFALEGQLAAKYPESAGKPVRLQLDCGGPPDEESALFIEQLNGRLDRYGLRLDVNVLP
jgi:hypothetical protein